MSTCADEMYIALLATGGTISSRSQSGSGGAAVASDDAAHLLASTSPGTTPVRVIDVLKENSFALRVEDMLLVCRKIREVLEDPQVLGVVVTHGTDTMEETAFLADLVHEDRRPVVFTGAQKAADAQAPDGPENLSRAISLAGHPFATGRGVLIYFADVILPAQGVRKTETERRSAFGNPDFGVVGTVTAEGEFSFAEEPAPCDPLPLPDASPSRPVRVDVVASYPGADATLLRASVDAGAAGIVLQGTGSGNANPALTAAVREAVAAGVVVVASTRVHAGPVTPIYGGGGGADLSAAGAIPSGLLRPSQSLILLSLLLRLGRTGPEIAQIFAERGGRP